MSITDISLSNFQCFGDEVTIPFSRLTFLFGPNSAGKSAVLDAFEILRATADDFWSGMQGTPPSYDEIVAQNDRVRTSIRANVAPAEADATENVQKAIATLTVRLRGSDCGSSDDEFAKKFCEKDISLKFGYGDRDWHYHQVVLTVTVDEVFLLSIGRSENTLNFAHPILRNTEEMDGIIASLAEGRDRRVVALANDRITFPCRGLTNLHNYYSREESKPAFWDQPGADDLPLIDLFDKVLRRLVYQLVLGIARFGGTPASRQVPGDTHLSYFIECGKQLSCGHNPFSMTETDEDFESFVLPTQGEPSFRPIAEALAATLDDYTAWTAWELWAAGLRGDTAEGGEEFDADEFSKEDMEEYVYWASKRRFVENVQRTLSEYLFRDVGYQIGFDHRVLMDRVNLERILSRADDGSLPLIVGKHPILVRLFLVDSKGKKLSFRDVGSGLAYVLPVVFNVWDPELRRVFLQQPELHLHPALQAPLGDLFIEASRNKAVIIETHSEHILLRVLKRIRQTASDHPLAEELRISPEAVSVLYFDPGPDGTTKVKRLRISPDGDFLDRWPRGFFAERDQELFDE